MKRRTFLVVASTARGTLHAFRFPQKKKSEALALCGRRFEPHGIRAEFVHVRNCARCLARAWNIARREGRVP